MVAEEMRAWHAGVASWGGVSDINSRSIGIEIANPGHELGHPPFSEPQMVALERLLSDLLKRHSIAPERVVGHACVAPGRKRDPGEKFDWRRLACRGLSVWLDPEAGSKPSVGSDAPSASSFQAAAGAFGYAVPRTGLWCPATHAVWCVFAMRFRPAEAALPPNSAGLRHLEQLAERWPAAPGA